LRNSHLELFSPIALRILSIFEEVFTARRSVALRSGRTLIFIEKIAKFELADSFPRKINEPLHKTSVKLGYFALLINIKFICACVKAPKYPL
jgi:hypothetical protein